MEITKAMKIAVTGASGYLGSTLIKETKECYEIIALGRGVCDLEDVRYLKTDYSKESLRGSLAGCDAVVHLAYAMATKENEQGGIESYRSSMEATRNVFETAMSLGIDNMVFASSRLVYPHYSETAFAEDSPLEPQNHYGKSKLAMEELCDDLNKKGGRIKVLRFGQIIGEGMKVRGMFQIFMERALKDEPLTLIGSDIRDYIYVEDACRAIKAAIDHPETSGAFNISMGIGTDNRAMAEGIIRALNSRSEVMVSDAPTKKQPDKIVLDCSKAEKELGFSCKYDTVFSIAKAVIGS